MQIELTGKTALVSASTGGIGLAIAKGLAQSGANVIVNGRSEASVLFEIFNMSPPAYRCAGRSLIYVTRKAWIS